MAVFDFFQNGGRLLSTRVSTTHEDYLMVIVTV